MLCIQSIQSIRMGLALLACTSLVLAPIAAHADHGTTKQTVRKTVADTPKAATPRTTVRDVKLNDTGRLTGQLVDSSGVALSEKKIRLLQGDHVVATTVSDKEGKFQVAGLRGGTYRIDATGTASTLRLWSHGTAPPKALEGVLLVSAGKTLRGNRGLRGIRSGLFAPSEGKALIAIPAVIGGAGIYQYQRQEDHDNSPAS